MSRAARALAIAAAWALPVVWVGATLTTWPSDGTAVSPPAMVSDAPTWDQGATVVRTYGRTVLEPGDVVLTVDGTPWEQLLVEGGADDRGVGEKVTYGIRRPLPGARPLGLQVDVTLTDVAARARLAQAWLATALAVLGLAVGSALVWRRPDSTPDRALLGGASLVACGLTTAPLGLAAIDVAGGRGPWAFLGGGILFAAGVALLVAVVVTLVPGSARPRSAWAAVAGPAAGYAVWALTVAAPLPPGAARMQALLTIAGPAAVGGAVTAVILLAYLQARAAQRPDRLAARLVLLVLLGGIGVRLALVDIPTQLLDQTLLPSAVVTGVASVTVLAGVVTALLRYRLDLVEPGIRRTLLQAALVAVVGGAFLAALGLVGRASDRPFGSMLAGGVIALLVLPLALAALRWLRRRLYGDRDLPRQVVAELRRLDPTDAPEQALQETLRLLTERLRLSYVAIEVDGDGSGTALHAAVGEPRGDPVTVELHAGGAGFGRLLLEADPDRDPFTSADRRTLADVGAEVGALLQAVQMSTELQRSRQHLITAREEERRRLRRDLHDGLGPSLATMAMRLEAARDLIDDDPRAAAELVERLSEQARDGIQEVRRLVDGLRPPALDQLGLVSALRLRAQDEDPARQPGEGMRWTVVADDDLEPLPAAVEVAAYLIAMEAVTNALRHSEAASCEVALSREDGVLVVSVSDDGVGLADDHRLGVGLTSMRERAEELGGSCTITAGGGSGTVVEARLPIREEAGR